MPHAVLHLGLFGMLKNVPGSQCSIALNSRHRQRLPLVTYYAIGSKDTSLLA